MFKALFNIIIDLLATLIQIVMFPINSIITGALPDLSSRILDTTNMLTDVFSNMYWALDLIPDFLTGVLIFVITCEISKHTIYIGTHVIIKVWNLFQKLKFW